MSKLFEKIQDGNHDYLRYHYESYSDIDDIILQLLNEVEFDGFVKSRIIRKESGIDYDVTGLKTLAEMEGEISDKDSLAGLYKNLNELIVFLSDSFIGMEYVVFDHNEVFVNPENGKLNLIVLPLELTAEEQSTLDQFVRSLKDIFNYPIDEQKALNDNLQIWKDKKITTENLADLISDLEGASGQSENDSVEEEIALSESVLKAEIKPEVAEEMLIESKKIFDVQEPIEEKTIIFDLPDIKEDVSKSRPLDIDIPEVKADQPVFNDIPIFFGDETEPASKISLPDEIILPDVEIKDVIDRPVSFDQEIEGLDILPEIPDVQIEKEEVPAVLEETKREETEELPVNEIQTEESAESIEEPVAEAEQKDPDTEIEETEEVAEKSADEAYDTEETIADPVESEFPVADEAEDDLPAATVIKAEADEQTIAQIREEMREDLRVEIEAELRREYESRFGISDEQIPAYVIRKNTGEVIQLTKETFIFGTKPVYCDYVITGNAYISNIHAIIRYNSYDQKYYMIDCNSKNGIYLNATRMLKNQITELKDGMLIFMANEVFIFHI